METLSTLITFSCSEKIDFLIKIVLSLAPDSRKQSFKSAFLLCVQTEIVLVCPPDQSSVFCLSFLPVFSPCFSAFGLFFFLRQIFRLWRKISRPLGRASWFLYGRILSVVQKHNLLCSFEQRIHLQRIAARRERRAAVRRKMFQAVHRF